MGDLHLLHADSMIWRRVELPGDSPPPPGYVPHSGYTDAEACTRRVVVAARDADGDAAATEREA